MIIIDVNKSKQCNDDISLFLSFPYDTTVIGAVRALSERYWDKDTKEWEVPTSALNGLLNTLNNYEFVINVADPTILKTDTCAESVDEIIKTYQYKTNPYKHQIDGFKYGLSHNKWLLGDEQGLGKTKEVIDIAVAKKQQKGYKHCLIICGVNGLKWNWKNEVATHSNESAYILGQRIKRNGNIVIGSNADKMEDVTRLSPIAIPEDEYIDDYFIITNVETLRNTEIVEALSDMAKNGYINMIAFDECHKCKDPQSQQGKGILKLQADTMIAMTGTPLMNSPLDLYSILKWLGYEKKSFYSFKNRYCVMGGYGGYQIIGYQNLEELQNRLNHVMLRRLKNDVLDLPEKVYIDEYVEMGKQQSIIYKEVTDDLKEHIDEVKVAPNPLGQLIRLRQATGCPSILASSVKESAKLDRMEELVEESVANNRQVVIFSNWTQMTDVAFERLHKRFAINQITGETKDEDRQRIVDQFQDGTYKVLIGTIGAMGTGLTLTAGTVVIFLDHPWNRALYDQAVDRCHRIGQNSSITIYNLLAKGTIDERIWTLVKKKGDISDALVDKEETLRYLLG